jgi:hypothetical protein
VTTPNDPRDPTEMAVFNKNVISEFRANDGKVDGVFEEGTTSTSLNHPDHHTRCPSDPPPTSPNSSHPPNPRPTCPPDEPHRLQLDVPVSSKIGRFLMRTPKTLKAFCQAAATRQ